MSEYQYYEFRAIDRPLRRDEMDELRKLSKRAEITATSLVNDYSFGSFRRDPSDLMVQYFDAFVYPANWGSRRLMFRIPRERIDFEAASAYEVEDCLTIEACQEHVVLDIRSESEPDGQ